MNIIPPRMIVTAGVIALTGVMNAKPAFSQPAGGGVPPIVLANLGVSEVGSGQSIIAAATNPANPNAATPGQVTAENNLNNAENALADAQASGNANTIATAETNLLAAELGAAGGRGHPALRAGLTRVRDGRAILEEAKKALVHYKGDDARYLRTWVRSILNKSKPKKPRTPKVASGPKKGLFGLGGRGAAMVAVGNTRTAVLAGTKRPPVHHPVCNKPQH